MLRVRPLAAAVVAEGLVPLRHGRAHPVALRALHELAGSARVPHQSVEDRAEQLRRGEAYVLVGLITFTTSSATARSTAASSSSGSGGTIVFRRSGRLSVIVATGPETA